MDNLAFLDGDEPEQIETAEPQQEAQPPQVEEQQPEPEAAPARDERGRFAPKEKEGDEGPIMVPLAALQEVRDELKALKAAAQPQSQPEQQPNPDIFDDPEGWQARQNQVVQSALYQVNRDACHRFATLKHGEEVVNEAVNWAFERCNNDPQFNASVLSQPDPIEFVIQQHQRDQVASQVGLTEFEEFKAWKAAQAQAQQQPAQAGQASATPPQSIASLPSSGGAAHVPTGPGQAFDTLFKQ